MGGVGRFEEDFAEGASDVAAGGGGEAEGGEEVGEEAGGGGFAVGAGDAYPRA